MLEFGEIEKYKVEIEKAFDNIEDVSFKNLLNLLTDKLSLYFDIFNNSPSYQFILKINGELISANELFKQKFLAPSERISNVSIFNFIDIQFHDKFRNFLDHNFSKKDSLNYLIVKFIDSSNHEIRLKLESKLFFDYSKNENYCQIIALNISEQKEIKRRLLQTNIKLLTIYEFSPYSIAIINLDGTIVDFNTVTLKLLGINSYEELIGKNILDFVSDKYKDLAKNDLISAYKLEKLESLNYNLLRKDIEFAAELSVSIIKEENDKPSGFVIITKDITKRIKDEILLKENEEKYRLLFENMHNGFAIFEFDEKNKNGKILEANDFFLKIIGFPKEITLLKSANEIFTNIDFGLFSKYRNILNEEKFYTFDYFYQHTEKYLKVHIYSFQKNKFTVILIDQTKIKLTELLYKENFNRYKSLFDNSLTAILYADITGKILEANSKLIEILGSPSIEETKRINLLTFKPLMDAGFSADFIKCIKTETTIFAEKEYNSKWDKKVYIRYYFNPIKKEDKIIGVLANVEDITESKNATQELIEQKEILKELNATKDKFFSVIGHDLKNPLNNILGFCDLIQSTPSDFEKDNILEILGYINKSAKNAFELLENLLQWSKSQSNKIRTNKQIIHLSEVVKNNVKLLEQNLNAKEIQLISEISPDYFIYADLNMTNTILRNLISNAIKYSYRKGIIYISSKEDGDYIIVNITDFGIGMENKTIENLFKYAENISIPGTENEKGTGLGLLLCKDFISKNDGLIEIESTLKEKTNVKLRFKKYNEGIISSQNEVKQIPKFKILVAEDEDINFIYISEMLPFENFEIVHAKNGKQAIELFESIKDFSLVLMDAKMPLIDGYDAAIAIKSMNNQIPVIMQTAYCSQDEIRKAFEAGCDDFIAKPIDKELFKRKINNFLNFQ